MNTIHDSVYTVRTFSYLESRVCKGLHIMYEYTIKKRDTRESRDSTLKCETEEDMGFDTVMILCS